MSRCSCSWRYVERDDRSPFSNFSQQTTWVMPLCAKERPCFCFLPLPDNRRCLFACSLLAPPCKIGTSCTTFPPPASMCTFASAIHADRFSSSFFALVISSSEQVPGSDDKGGAVLWSRNRAHTSRNMDHDITSCTRLKLPSSSCSGCTSRVAPYNDCDSREAGCCEGAAVSALCSRFNSRSLSSSSHAAASDNSPSLSSSMSTQSFFFVSLFCSA
mmetsp:Transcript_50999/g.82501  ORF Transcript_50999/g.82501 Transcript_50999/m.82501 type:complete len:216 (-) Transcript_50999:246-893(-)